EQLAASTLAYHASHDTSIRLALQGSVAFGADERGRPFEGSSRTPPTRSSSTASRRLTRDDSGRVSASGRVSRGSRVVARFQGDLVADGRIYTATWTPRKRGRYSWCNTAQDASGNRGSACASVRVR